MKVAETGQMEKNLFQHFVILATTPVVLGRRYKHTPPGVTTEEKGLILNDDF